MNNAIVDHDAAVERIIASQLLHIEERIDLLNRYVERLGFIVGDNEGERSMRHDHAVVFRDVGGIERDTVSMRRDSKAVCHDTVIKRRDNKGAWHDTVGMRRETGDTLHKNSGVLNDTESAHHIRHIGDNSGELGSTENTLQEGERARHINVLSREIRGMVGDIARCLRTVERWMQEMTPLSEGTPLMERYNRCRSMMAAQLHLMQSVKRRVAEQSAVMARKIAHPVAQKLGVPSYRTPYAARFINRTA